MKPAKLFTFFIIAFITATNAFAQQNVQKIDELLKQYYDYGQFNGSVLVAEKGKVIYKKSFGMANMEWAIPNQPDTKFRIGSVTKQFSATLVLQLVEEGKIMAVLGVSETPPDIPVTDCSTYVLMPGLVDAHTHINEPGRTEWEGFETATRAAAAGGFTTLVDMPLNCLPATTTVAALEVKRAAATGKCTVDWSAWGGICDQNAAHIEPLAIVCMTSNGSRWSLRFPY